MCPTVRRGVRLRGEAARRAEAVSDGNEGERGRSGGAGAGQVASWGGIGAVGRRRTPQPLPDLKKTGILSSLN